MTEPGDSPADRQVFAGGQYRRFGDLTAADARALSAELRGAASGPLAARVGPVARTWAELADLIDRRGLGAVADLDAETATDYARRLWVISPSGGLL